ncbi:hypothetical protein ACFLWI_05955 [Chloroflexota bacterium]
MDSNNPFKGVNKACAQCANDCKQFENVTLIACPKFKSSRTEDTLSCRREKRTRMRNKGDENGY